MIALFFHAYIYLVKAETEISISFSHMKIKLRLGIKADILHCLEKKTTRPVNTPIVNAKLLNGAAIVHMLNP